MKVGFTCGAFDLLHAGHIMMLKEAKSVCDELLVGLQTNPKLDRPSKRKPIQSLFERYMQLAACKYVDRIIIYETEQDLQDILSIYAIDIRIVGEDHKKPKGQLSVRDKICKERGIEIYYNSRKHRFSTTELIQRIKKSK